MNLNLNGTFEITSNLAQDRGDCNFDIRHIFNASVVGTTPLQGHSLFQPPKSREIGNSLLLCLHVAAFR